MSNPYSLEERFPEMKPVSKPPALSTVNGIGMMVYGKRDFDQETWSYVKTQVFCILFVPVLALGAYRVVDAQGGGWFFLGRVPLSALARFWNWAVLASILIGVGVFFWVAHTGTAEYAAGREVARAEDLVAQGKVGQAAQVLVGVARGHTAHAGPAAIRIGELVDHPGADADQRLQTFQAAMDLHRSGKAVDQLAERGMDWTRKLSAEQPEKALLLADKLRVLLAEAPQKQRDAELQDLRFTLLEKAVASKPDDVNFLAELATIHEARKDLEKCERLLAPRQAKLGSSEGARILGQIYAQQGKFEEALELLSPYAEVKLKALHKAEKDLHDTVKRVDQATLTTLQQGTAPGFDFALLKRSGKDAQDRMVSDYMDNVLRHDDSIRAARDAVRKEAGVVPVALDLGMVLLRRGQAASDPQVRQRELEKAEKTFLEVGGVAGQHDEFRSNLGQVYYWLGKHDKGKQLFDQLLKTHNRDASTLLLVAQLLREVGVVSEARQLADEAYEKAADANVKFGVASFRSLIPIDREDKITWLKRGHPANKSNQAALAQALGDEAMGKGEDETAARHYRESIDLYKALPEDAAMLNNIALSHQSLFRATGDLAELDHAVGKLERAIGLKPGDSILIQNTAHVQLSFALGDILGKEMDLRLLKQEGNLKLPGYLYKDRAGREAYRKKMLAHPGVTKALAQYERAILLAPKKAANYQMLAGLTAFTRDMDGLRNLQRRLSEVELDHADAQRRQKEALDGKDDDKHRQELAGLSARLRKEMDAAKKVGGPTWAAAVDAWLQIESSRNMIGPRLPAHEMDALVALMDEVHQSVPSMNTQTMLMTVLLTRAHHKLMDEEPAYASLAKPAERPLGPSYLLAVALSREGTLPKTCLANADVRRVVDLVKESAAQFPDSGTFWAWAMLRHAAPDDAAKIKKAILADELYDLTRRIGDKLAPLNSVEILDRYWSAQLHDDPTAAAAALALGAKEGLPLPKLK